MGNDILVHIFIEQKSRLTFNNRLRPIPQAYVKQFVKRPL